MSIEPAEQPHQPASSSSSASFSSWSVPTLVAAVLAALREVVDVLAGLDPADLDGPGATALVGELHAQTDRLTAVYLGALPVIKADGRWAGRGAELPGVVGRAAVADLGVGGPP